MTISFSSESGVVCSVLIPAFNATDTIAETINSVRAQDFPMPIEILVCDDASTDNTVSVISELVDLDPRVKLLRNSTNQGVSHTRNKLLDSATGCYIAFLDSDDVFLPSKISRTYNVLSVSSAAMVCHGLGYLTAGGGVSGNINASEFLPASLIKRTDIGTLRFKTTLPVGEDTDFFRQIMARCDSIRISDVLTAIRIRPGSLTDKDWFDKRIVEHWHATRAQGAIAPNSMSSYFDYYKSLGFLTRTNLYRKWLGQKLGRQGAGYIFAGKRKTAIGYLCMSLLLSPTYLFHRLFKNR